MTTNTLTLVTCPGGCNEQLDPSYITRSVIIDGDSVKVCDVCAEQWEPEVERVATPYEEAMERKFDEMRLEGRRLA